MKVIIGILFLSLILSLTSDVTPERHVEAQTDEPFPLTLRDSPPRPHSQEEWTMIFEEEFSGDAWRDKWNIQDWPSDKNEELQYYTPDNVLTKNGYLILSSKSERYKGRHYTSGAVTTEELASACSVFSYYSHTFDFHHRKGSSTKDKKSFLITEEAGAIRKDVAKSIGVLKGESLAFAYPYGEYSPKSIRILKELGIDMAFTTEERDASQDDHLYELPRHSIFHDTTMTRFQSIFRPHH
ncbi:hypothetical protein [Rossellomorea marisflavi]|uniref:hypothetical protein n=1 Tax=Rossellomorea marisflavi TaxID=189381 RepID=UPI00207A917B|nr:hypothetical protein [Rossellomorea marisflavi]USK91688.1 hypothetical protein LIT29_19585 [Rossellomorea marisflavi]